VRVAYSRNKLALKATESKSEIPITIFDSFLDISVHTIF